MTKRHLKKEQLFAKWVRHNHGDAVASKYLTLLNNSSDLIASEVLQMAIDVVYEDDLKKGMAASRELHNQDLRFPSID